VGDRAEAAAPVDAGDEMGRADAHEDAHEGAHDAGEEQAERPTLHCPSDMVKVDDRFCIDRYEATLVDDATGKALSPHYPPEPGVGQRMFEKWEAVRLSEGLSEVRGMPLPVLPEIEQTKDFRPRAVNRRGVLPQAYTSGKVAAEACARAHKRLCTREEWVFACRGERQTYFPYGDGYRPGVCNVFRGEHPAQILHGNASVGHSDPRLGLVEASDGPLLRRTGDTRTCASRWGGDAVYDMVGNVDEWIDDPNGTFVGGFFSRGTKEGCDAGVATHPYTYWDYSTGVRCCR
jgi:formylglycine-generating enzyme